MQCDHEEEHAAKVRRAKENMPAEGSIGLLAAQFKALSEPSRLKILFALRQGELCVNHILEIVGGTQSALSHQLRILRDNRIIRARRDGQNIVYALADAHVTAALELSLAHAGCSVGEETP